VCDYPEHEIAEAPLTFGADQEVDSTRRQREMPDLVEQMIEVLRCQLQAAIGTPCGFAEQRLMTRRGQLN